MSKGSITNFGVRVEPSQDLIDFIKGLENIQSMPDNILRIYQTNSKGDKNIKRIENQVTIKEKLTEREIGILKSISLEQLDCEKHSDVEDIDSFVGHSEEQDEKVETSTIHEKRKTHKNRRSKHKILLELGDIRWLDKLLTERRRSNECSLYLHELIHKCQLILPENELIPRNPELEARCRKLREEQDTREYRNMTKNVDAARKDHPDDTIAFQLKSMNRQLIAVLQFIFSVAAGFAFGFIGVELILGNLDFGFRLLLGIMCALTIALAEIYFLAKKLNEYDEIEDDPDQLKVKKQHLD